MGESFHGEVEWAAFRNGDRLPTGSTVLPDLRIVWVQHPSADQIARIGAHLGIPAEILARTRERYHRARVDRHGSVKFFALRPARYIDKTEEVQFGEVQMITGDDYVVLLGKCGIFQLEAFIAKLERKPDQLAHGPSAVLHAALDAVVDGYEPVVLGLENDIDEIEDEVFHGEKEPLRRIYELIREVIGFQRATDPLEDLLAALLRREGIPDEERRFLVDAHERALLYRERAAAFRSLLESVLQVNLALETKKLSEVSIQQADQMKKISSWAAILFTPTLIGGTYGMNFEHMPELAWQYGYPFALGLMLFIGVTLFVLFRRRDWI
jgi:magnesium transporter